MRIKTILSLIALITTFTFSIALVGMPANNFYSRYVQRQAKKNILTLLQQDIDNGDLRYQRIKYLDRRAKRAHSSFDIEPYAKATADYVDASESIDDDSLPADFQAAWQEHMNAWRAQRNYLNERKASAAKYKVDGQEIIQYSLNPDDENLYQKQVDEINLTWYEVLRIGRKYGAFVNEY